MKWISFIQNLIQHKQTMKISIIHPTRNRPKEAYETAMKWYNNADNSYQYILSLDNDDYMLHDYLKLFELFQDNKIIKAMGCTYDNKSAIEAINRGAKQAKCDILIVVSDDTDCPEHWDTLLLEQLKGKSDFCAKVDDGLQPTLVTMPIMDRIYYERYGYIYNPAYQHMFVDQELTAVAIMTGKYIKLPLLFPHNHYSTGKTQKDALNSRNDATWQQGERLFNERLKTNFDIENPVISYSEIKWR